MAFDLHIESFGFLQNTWVARTSKYGNLDLEFTRNLKVPLLSCLSWQILVKFLYDQSCNLYKLYKLTHTSNSLCFPHLQRDS